MRRELIYSLLDQGLLSVFNLGLSILMITLTTPAEFGMFVLYYASGFVLLSVQNALVVMPANYLLPGRGPEERAEKTSLLSSINLVMSLFGAGAGAALFLLYPGDTALLAAVSAYYGFALLREFARNLYIVDGRMHRALLLDGLTVGFSIAAAMALWSYASPAAAAIGGVAIGNLAALLLASPRLRLRPARIGAHMRDYMKLWAETRWGLAGAVLTEAQVRSYVYFVEAWKGVAELGSVQAGRTLLSPLTLCATAWSRIARPRMVASIYERREAEVPRLLVQGLLVMAVLALAYGAAILAAWPWIDALIFGDKYPDLSFIILLWWVYASVMSLNYVTAAVLQARRQFRALAIIGGIGSVMALMGLAGVAQTAWAVEAALIVLIVTEFAELACQGWFIARRAGPQSLAAPA